MPGGCRRCKDAGAARPQSVQLSMGRTLRAMVASAVHVGCTALPHEGRYRDRDAGCEARHGKAVGEKPQQKLEWAVCWRGAQTFPDLLLPACELPDADFP